MVCDSRDVTNFSYKLLLNDTQFSRLCKDFANNSSANIKLLKTQLFKMVQLEWFLGHLSCMENPEKLMISTAITLFSSIKEELDNKEGPPKSKNDSPELFVNL